MQERGYLSLAKFILTMDTWFDCMNAGILIHRGLFDAAMLPFDCDNSSTMKSLRP